MTASRFAALLLHRASSTLPLVPEEQRAPLVTALDSFLLTPTAICYLQAMRLLQAADYTYRPQALQRVRATKAKSVGLEQVAKLGDWGAALATKLAALPLDRHVGQRLHALAALA